VALEGADVFIFIAFVALILVIAMAVIRRRLRFFFLFAVADQFVVGLDLVGCAGLAPFAFRAAATASATTTAAARPLFGRFLHFAVLFGDGRNPLVGDLQTPFNLQVQILIAILLAGRRRSLGTLGALASAATAATAAARATLAIALLARLGRDAFRFFDQRQIDHVARFLIDRGLHASLALRRATAGSIVVTPWTLRPRRCGPN
jgi:hypothetical protein